MQDNESLVVPFFYNAPVKNEAASKEAGRPIYRDVEMVELRIAGERHYKPVFRANEMWKRINGDEVTYADRFEAAYERFSAGKEQVADGTPLSELPFLTESKRAELRGLKVYTAEALSSMDGAPLKALGGDGREMKNQATAYLDRAGGTAGTVALAAEVEQLRAELASLRSLDSAMDTAPVADDGEKESLKLQIAEISGARPKGNPSVDTLREMLNDMKAVA